MNFFFVCVAKICYILFQLMFILFQATKMLLFTVLVLVKDNSNLSESGDITLKTLERNI